MAQESWKNEIDETEYQKHESPIVCANNCGFFGSLMTNNLCSKCYRDLVMKQKVLAVLKPRAVASSSSIPEPFPEQSEKLKVIIAGNVETEPSEAKSNKHPPNRCLMCHKKVGLTGFKCRCGSTFCSAHRYPETHQCSFDYKFAGKETIAKENPVVKANKIEKV